LNIRNWRLDSIDSHGRRVGTKDDLIGEYTNAGLRPYCLCRPMPPHPHYGTVLKDIRKLYDALHQGTAGASPTVFSTTTPGAVLDNATPYPMCSNPEHRPALPVDELRLDDDSCVATGSSSISVSCTVFHLGNFSPLSYVGPGDVFFKCDVAHSRRSREQLAVTRGVLVHPPHYPENATHPVGPCYLPRPGHHLHAPAALCSLCSIVLRRSPSILPRVCLIAI
jgi:hypothetical protein